MKPDELIVTVRGEARTVRILPDGLVSVDGVEHSVTLQQQQSGPAILQVNGQVFRVSADRALNDSQDSVVTINGQNFDVTVDDRRTRLLRSMKRAESGVGGVMSIKAPMPGLVVKVEVKAGQIAQKGEGLLILEAMKMENELKCEKAGKVMKVLIEERMAVEKGQLLMTIDTSIQL